MIKRKHYKPLLWLCADVVFMLMSFGIAASLLNREADEPVWLILILVILLRCVLLVRSGCYRAVLRYSGMHTLVVISAICLIGSLFAMTVAFMFHLHNFGGLGRAFLLLELMLTVGLLGFTRILVRVYYNYKNYSGISEGRNVCIYGAGKLGEITLRNLRIDGFQVVGFVDDNKDFHGRHIHGKVVHGSPEKLEALLKKTEINILVVAIMDIPTPRLKNVFHICMDLGIRVKVVRGVEQVMDDIGNLSVDDLSMEDLLQRPRRNLSKHKIYEMLGGRVVLVTGGGGSIGSEICRQVYGCNIQKLVILDHSEFNLYSIESELKAMNSEAEVVPILGTLTNQSLLKEIFDKHRPEVIYHAAAYKHVPLVEANPIAGIENNIKGLLNLIKNIDDFGGGRLVQISTDKAVRPTNVMGATKRVCEMIIQNYPSSNVNACAVRFGNVLGSSGSVIPKFLGQIKSGGPVTVTDPEMTRYFMLIPEAVQLVLHSGALASRGQIFILDMGQPVKIVDLARQLIFMAGKIPDVDVSIEFSGLRPGEKLYEELIINDAEGGTEIEGILIAHPLSMDYEQLESKINSMLSCCDENNARGVLSELSALVPEWQQASVD